MGVASAVVGLLPWILTGMRLPLQNLWGTDTLPAEMPIALLPFSQYSITLIAGIIVVGAAIAGVVARSTRARQGRFGLAALTAGVLVTQVIATVQAAVVVGNGLRPGRESLIYLVAVVSVATASFVVGALVLVLIARMPRAGALIGLGIAAVAVGWWLGALVVHRPGLVTETQTALLGLLRWVPAILCGVAIGWCGVNTVGRVVAAVTALASAVIGPAIATAVSSATGTRVLARYPAEMLEYGVQVFQQVLGISELTLRPILTAIIVAAAVLAFKAVLRRRRAPLAEACP
ncbi:hypothetical protein GY21_04220 [Cryobacterium roopkundense]|uniref:Uncharacterized protein n=1 Tax=Cryobacterium roopkundense TaxID=1001240 RepID=A0A099JMX8_9MICO|nr:hypothetical protein GY21_04220 [Cryobacterium roopkundense]